MAFTTPPPAVQDTEVTFPRPHVLLVTLNRPKAFNAMPRAQHPQLAALWDWYDAEPSLRCAVLTGAGRAFCAGADLREWNDKASAGATSSAGDERDASWATSGFGGLSNRRGKKPVIAAVNGACLGGGMEMALNADVVLAAAGATFGLPEVKVGVIAVAGALPRLTRIVGRQRAAEMALLGRTYKAGEMAAWGVVNKVVEEGGSVVEEALRWAEEVAGNSPDAVIVTRAGLLGGWDPVDPVKSTGEIFKGIYKLLEQGENLKEGVKSFVEKKRPVWKDSKL
ncbi:enoyl-CoA hydratase [Cordyceps fumosorosea ARSEF 2679]|uniref:Enoyl-CoA hydratase n=1 Tax=Cordyceps fumosorosea (strain ARSEF 2679) TaxID=1081104 RepID=A0A167R5H8_CORFA|nr:enoyl-CoA hydratase [Cordyceps fumosorosea ARSEF 2679]OAA58290.1 enoyl-CoA hydratase [Cordyceps fumosorosea ARSEF 2679]